MMKIAILLTVYNRKIETLKSLKHLHKTLSKHDDLHYEIFMVNDGCTDGTELEVERLFPNINIINSKVLRGSKMKIAISTESTADLSKMLWFLLQ